LLVEDPRLTFDPWEALYSSLDRFKLTDFLRFFKSKLTSFDPHRLSKVDILVTTKEERGFYIRTCKSSFGGSRVSSKESKLTFLPPFQTTPSPSSTSTTSTTSTPSPPSSRPKAPSLFVANPDGSFTTSPRPHPPSSPPSPRPPTPKPVSRLRQHLSQWIQFKALPEEEKLEIEKKIRKKVKAVEGISSE